MQTIWLKIIKRPAQLHTYFFFLISKAYISFSGKLICIYFKCMAKNRTAYMPKGACEEPSFLAWLTVSVPPYAVTLQPLSSWGAVWASTTSRAWSTHAYTHAYHPFEPAARLSPSCLLRALQKSLCDYRWNQSHQ